MIIHEGNQGQELGSTANTKPEGGIIQAEATDVELAGHRWVGGCIQSLKEKIRF